MVPGEALFCFWWLRKTKWKGLELANLENLGDIPFARLWHFSPTRVTYYSWFARCWYVLAIVGLIMGIKTRCNQTQHRGCVLTLKTIWKEKEKRQPHCCSGFVPGCTHLEVAFPVGLTGVRYFSYASCPKQIQVRRFSCTFLARLACVRMNQAIVFTRRKTWTTEWRLPDLDTSHGWMIEEISLVQALHRCKKYFTPWKRCRLLLSKKELERWDWNMENLKGWMFPDVVRASTKPI